jgi:hypothetical protein
MKRYDVEKSVKVVSAYSCMEHAGGDFPMQIIYQPTGKMRSVETE